MRIGTAIPLFLMVALNWGCLGKTAPVNNAATPGQSSPEVHVIEPSANIDLPPGSANRTIPGRTIMERANRGQRVDANPNSTPAPLQFRPAAENSQIAVSMDADGTVREIRIFKNHPRLARVEATLLQSGERNVKLFMKSGQVVKVKTNRLENLEKATVAELLAIAGR